METTILIYPRCHAIEKSTGQQSHPVDQITNLKNYRPQAGCQLIYCVNWEFVSSFLAVITESGTGSLT